MLDRFRFAIRERQRRKWEKKRKHGKQSFLIYRGVLRWGIFMFVLYLLTDRFILHQKIDWILVTSLLLGCLLIGYIWALCRWVINERRFGYKSKQ
jgi:uncharacterized protein YqhQ